MSDIDTPSTAVTSTLFAEDFRQGLVIGDRWNYVEAPGFVSDDGMVRPTPNGISITPPARNDTTGEPMFTKDARGFAGHLKWMVFTPAGVATGDSAIRVAFRATAQCFGMERHPYGSAVGDADADFRLGAATLNVLDFSTGLVFDFWLTNSQIVPFYERIRPPDAPFQYAAFTAYSTPVPRDRNSVHDLAVIVSAAQGTVQWEVDGTVVASVVDLGRPADGWTTILDHGGTAETVVPQQLQVGLGLMTLLDASLPPSPRGLVDIGAHLVHPTSFVSGDQTLFGQGVRLDVQRIVIESQ